MGKEHKANRWSQDFRGLNLKNHILLIAPLLVLSAMALTACDAAPDQTSGPEQTSSPNDPQQAIVHGQQLRSNEMANSVVALVSELSEGQALCTGSILSDNSILTAAHCVDDNPEKMIVVFAKNLHSAKEKSVRPVIGFAQSPYWRHPNTEAQGDLAVVHFSGGLPPNYAPVHLAKASEQIKEGQPVYLIGYGVTNGRSQKGSGILRGTVTEVIGEQSPTETITDGKKTSVCFGDSGGPAFVKVKNQYVQWGVASSVFNQACNEASIHTNIMSYLTWIENEAELSKNRPLPTTPRRGRQQK